MSSVKSVHHTGVIGFDGYRADDAEMLDLSEWDYYWLTKRVRTSLPEAKIVSLLEGGYNAPSTANSAILHILALIELRSEFVPANSQTENSFFLPNGARAIVRTSFPVGG